MSEYIRQNSISINYKTGESWVILSEIEQSIKNKIEAAGIPLKDWNIYERIYSTKFYKY